MNYLLFFFTSISLFTFSQETKITWEDKDKREFSISIPSGELSYEMIVGDKIIYDLNGRVSKVGPVKIKYNFRNKIVMISSIKIEYNFRGKVIKIGNLSIKYDLKGRIISTEGKVK